MQICICFCFFSFVFYFCDVVARRTFHEEMLHNLILCNPSNWLCVLHGVAAIGILIFDKGKAQWPSAVLVTGELICRLSTLHTAIIKRRNILIAVSAFSVVSNCTTPVPRERPLGSYWISARSTFPMVVKSSTKSSLLVDHGSFAS